MKKLLATLLVAAMLISCMTIVAFAAVGDGTTEFYTVASAPGADYSAAMDSVYVDLIGAAAAPTSFGEGDWIVFPVSFTNNTGIAKMGIEIYYDPNVLEPDADYADLGSDLTGFLFNPAYNTTTAKGAVTVGNSNVNKTFGNMPVTGTGMNTSIAADGNVQLMLFKVKDGVTNATTTVSFAITDFGAYTSKGGEQVNYPSPTVTQSSMAITIGSGASKPEKITADSDTTAGAVTVSDAVVLADTSAFTAAAGDDAAFIASKANVVNNDGDPTLYDGTYQIFFGKNNYSGVTTAPDKVGLALYEGTTLKGLYEAKSFSADGKWGILFFGLDSNKTYSTKQYIQYDGEAAIIAE